MLATYLEVALFVAYLLLLVTVAGLALASFIPALPTRARWALAPTLGLALAICLFTTANWVVPGNTAAFLIPVLLVAGAAIIWRRRAHLRPAAGSRPWGSLAELLALPLIVFAVFTYPLGIQHSLGPGGFQVWDGPNYAAVELMLQTHAVDTDKWGPDWDLTARDGKFNTTDSHQQIGFQAVASTVDAGIGVEPVRTQASFMIALILIGTLGAYGAVTGLAGRWRPVPLLAALLYAGPVLFQLMLDGSESAIAGMAMMLPAVFLGSRLLSVHRSRGQVVLFALLVSGLQSAYPIFMPGFAAAAAVFTLGWLIWRTVARAEGLPGLALVVGGAAATTGLAVLFSPFAFWRNLYYWQELLNGDDLPTSLPRFDLPFPVVPSWLFGTREFYFLPHVTDTDVSQWLQGDLLPIILIALALAAALVWRPLLPLVVLVAITITVTLTVGLRNDCSYCVQRSLLPLGPLLGTFVAIGIGVVATWRFTGVRFVSVLLLLGTFGAVWHTNRTMAERGARGAYFVPKTVLDFTDRAAREPGPLLLEGFGQAWDAPAELPTVYHTARGGSDTRLVLARENDDYAGLAYIGGPQDSGPTFLPGYRTVLTRLGPVETDRQVIARQGMMALERRTSPWDVTTTAGTLVNRLGVGPQKVFVAQNLSFSISGPPGPPPAFRVVIAGIHRDRIGELPEGASVSRVRGGYAICVPVAGEGAVRRADIHVVNPPLTTQFTPGWFTNHTVTVAGPSLTSMRVVPGC